MGRKGKVLSYAAGSGKLLDLDESDIVFPFVSADVTGVLAAGDIADYTVDGVGENASAKEITKVEG